MPLRILLLQARTADDPMKTQERLVFAEQSGLPLESFVSHDLLTGPPSLVTVRAHDAVMIGGSGDFLVSQRDLPMFDATLDALAELATIGHPLFASCFGFQFMVEAMGGEIVFDPANTEVGTYPVELTAAGERDPLLGKLPKRFPAQMGRKDRAARLPPGIENLAQSERCPFQAFRIPGQPIWATQFHPELTGEANLARFRSYIRAYSPHLSAEDRRTAYERFGESRETGAILPRFLELVFGLEPAVAQPL